MSFFISALSMACALLFFCLWIDQKSQTAYQKSRYKDLEKRHIAYMNKREHNLSCDKCDARVGCTKYSDRSFYIACPFFEHTPGGI